MVRRGDILRKVLEALAEAAVLSSDLFVAFMTAGYGASYGKLEHELSKRRTVRDRASFSKEKERNMRVRYQKLIYKLKDDGLVEEKEGHRGRFFVLTKRGREKLGFLKNKLAKRLPSTFSYRKETGDRLVIVSFDIPEKEKWKREWIRSVLKNLGFVMVQKSVWLGKAVLPREFLDDLFRLGLVPCVEIFEVSKVGSLKRLV